MFEVTLSREKVALTEIYKKAFKERFGQDPVIDTATDYPIFEWAINTLTFPRAKELLAAYLGIEDDWIEEQGFPLGIFKKQINRVIVAIGNTGQIPKEWFLVGHSESGVPVVSKNRNILLETGFKPIPWEKTASA